MRLTKRLQRETDNGPMRKLRERAVPRILPNATQSMPRVRIDCTCLCETGPGWAWCQWCHVLDTETTRGSECGRVDRSGPDHAHGDWSQPKERGGCAGD